MKKQAAGLLLALGCITLFAGGCANKEVVKPGESLAPTATVAGQDEPESAGTAPAAGQTEESSATNQGSAADVELTPVTSADLAAALEDIYFDFDRYTLSREARDILVKNAQLLKKELDGKLQIAGHCDERGSDEYNLALSESRAKTAMQYLIALGVPAERLTVIGYGKEKPAAAGHDEASWAMNRRDEFQILGQ